MPKIGGMIVQSGGSKPHTVFIMETLARQFPYTIWKLGGYNKRKTASGGKSFHADGRAIDIYLDADHRADKTLGDLLFNMFHVNHVTLKVDHVIWDKQIWSEKKGGPRAYKVKSRPHKDHIHVGFKDDALHLRPLQAEQLCKKVHAQYAKAEGVDIVEGIYGKAFGEKRPNVRLTNVQRHRIMLKNMGMAASDPALESYHAARRRGSP